MKIKLIDKNFHSPIFKTSGSVGLDLYSRETILIFPNEMALIPLNVVIECEEPYFAGLLPRSSLYKKKNLILANSLGVIDRDYCGENDEIKAQLINIGDTPIEIKAGEDIMQLVFFNVTKPNLEIVENMQNQDRGGFSSKDNQ